MNPWLRWIRYAPTSSRLDGNAAKTGIFLWLAFTCAASQANTITVDDPRSGGFAGVCTLQDAVAAANTNAAVNGCAAGAAGLDTIVFAPGITSVVLTSAMSSASPSCTFGLAVGEDLAIDGGATPGSGVPKVSIQRSSASGTPNFGIVGASLYNCGTAPTVKLKLTLSGLTLGNGNNAGSSGGGVAADILTVRDSVISGNTAANGGGIYAFASLAMTSSTVDGNSAVGSGASGGGGIAGDVPMTISGSTISRNIAAGGGGIYAQGGAITIDNSTISGNTGSGIDTGSIAAYFVTVTANSGAGVLLEVATINNSVAEFDDSVIVGNGSPPSANDVQTSAARPITGTYNYFGSLSTVALNDLDAGVRIATCASLNLGPLANNGGGTLTHALLPGSCLIDAGGITSPGGQLFAHDQRGSGYPRFVNTHADIGAYEFQGGPAAVNGVCGTDNGQTLSAVPVNLCSAGTASAVAGNGHPWSWTCSGSNGGTNANCAATIRTWTVSAAVSGTGGNVSPPTQTVDNGATASVTAAPAAGYRLAGASGCGGSLSGNVYTTAAITDDCAITVSFTAAPISAPVGAPALSIWAVWLLAVGIVVGAMLALIREFGFEP